MTALYLLFSFFLVTGDSATSDNHASYWTRFRGADGLGIDNTARVPVRWAESDYRWNIELTGTGHGSPVVWDSTIFVTGSDDEKDLGFLMALDEQDGDVLWIHEFRIGDLSMHVDNNLAAPSPAVDESQVYTIWYSKDLTMLTALSHEGALRWQAEFGGIEARHGGGSSLMLTENCVIFTREQEEGSSQRSSWLAVNKQTGETAWEIPRESAENNSFSTPALVRAGDSDSVIIFTSQAHGFTAVEPETGAMLWERKSLLKHRTVASPVCSNGRIVGCRNGETVVLEVDENLRPVADTARYSLAPNLSPYVPTPLVVGELLFLFMDSGSIACLELASGKVLWKERPAGPIYGSPVSVGGRIYCITKAGKVVVLEARPTFELLGINDLGDESFASPVMAPSGMVFRTYTRLMMLGKTG